MAALRFGPFTLDAAEHRLDCRGVEVPLQPKVFDTLSYLVRHPGRAVSKDELLAEVWPDAVVGEAALTRCVKEVRQALGDDSRAPRFVKTLPRVGYRFVAPVESAGERDEPDRIQVIAVLPFRPLLAENRDESLELGMADTLIARLSGLHGLVVRPLGAVRRYAGLEQDPLEAGREQGVDAVVDGSLQQQGDRLRVTVRVLRIPDGAALVSEHFEEPFGDIFAVQDAICRRVAGAISMELDADETRRIDARRTHDPAAYRHFLMGRLALGRVTPNDARRSLPHFERALALDPSYADAYASLAEAHIVIGTLGIDPAESYAEVRRAARRALDLAPDLGGAWACLGTAAWQHGWDWKEADRLFARAVELAPNVVDIWCGYSDSCSFTARHAEGVAHARRALEVDPTSPMARTWLAQALYMAGDPEPAMAEARATLARAPGFPFALFFTGLGCLVTGRTAEAVDWLEQACASGRPDFAGVLAHAYVRAGREEPAAAIESMIRAAIDSGDAPPVALAPIHAARGDADLLFEVLEQTFARRGWHVLLLPSEPILAPFRDDPRAIDLIRRLGLDPR